MKSIIEIWKPLSGTLKTVIVGVVLFLGYVIYKKTTTVIPTLKFSNVKSGQITKEKTFLIKGKLTPANTVLYLSDSSLKKLPTQNGEFEYEAALPDSLNKVDFVIEYKDQKINRSVSIIRELSAQEIAQRKKELEDKDVTPKTTDVDLVFDIKTIVGKSPQEVEKILGTPSKKEKITGYPCKYSACIKYYYQKEKYEVIFKKGKPSRIVIYSFPNLTTYENAIQSLGFPKSKSTFFNPSITVRWENIDKYHEIAFFYDYALVVIDAPEG